MVTDKKKIVVLGSGSQPHRPRHRIRLLLRARGVGRQGVWLRDHHDQLQPRNRVDGFDTADKLYFEPVFWEHIYDIILHEKPEG